LVLTTEFLGADTTDQGNPPDETVVVDEVTITLPSETGIPFYLVVGRLPQPFGAFFAHIVSDPMAQDAYEVKQVGATVGYETFGKLSVSYKKRRAGWAGDGAAEVTASRRLMSRTLGILEAIPRSGRSS